METIGQRIKSIRKSMKLNQEAFSLGANISQGALSDIENDNYRPSIESIISISRYCRRSIDFILTGDEFFDDSMNNKFNLTENDLHILRLYKKLSQENQLKVEGMIEMKLAENEIGLSHITENDENAILYVCEGLKNKNINNGDNVLCIPLSRGQSYVAVDRV
jgi:DNA-binding XRE family transcriptional regulator